jgi:periplasmic divalent cation tolerance protein
VSEGIEIPTDQTETGVSVILCTAPTEKAAEIAKMLVHKNLVACVNILPSVRSIYVWDGKLCDENEALIILKTRSENFAQVSDAIREAHPSNTPEIIELNVARGDAKYLDWVWTRTESK